MTIKSNYNLAQPRHLSYVPNTLIHRIHNKHTTEKDSTHHPPPPNKCAGKKET